MKIITKNLKQYFRVYGVIKKKGNAYFEHVFLDFKNDKLYFLNDTTYVKMSLIIEDKDEKIENMFVNGTQFFMLVQSYDFLTIKGKTFYSPSNDSFILPTLNETEMSIPDFGDDSDDWTHKELKLDDYVLSHFRNALFYADPSTDSPLHNLFIRKGRLIAIQKNRMYFADVLNNTQDDFTLPQYLVKIMNTLSDIDTVAKIHILSLKNGRYKINFTVNDMSVLYTTNPLGELPLDVFSAKFREMYFHNKYVVFDTKELFDGLTFISNLMGDVVNSRVLVSFKEDDQGSAHAVFEVRDSGNIQYKVPVKEFNEDDTIIGESFWISMDNLKVGVQNCSKWGKEQTVFREKEGAPTLYIAGEKDDDTYILQTLLRSPEAE